MVSNIELMNVLLMVAGRTKRPIGNPPPPPPRLPSRNMPQNSDDPPPPPPPPPLGCGRILLKLYEHDGITVSDLAEELGIRNPSVSEAVRRLDEKGLIQRNQSHADRRIQTLCLSTLGIEAAKKYESDSEDFASHFLCALSAEEKQTLYDILNKLLKENS